MTNPTTGIDDNIDEQALDSLSVAPDGSTTDQAPPARDDAGTDEAIEDRVEEHPDDSDARLDRGLDETMDASDPVSVSQPGVDAGPAPSSGYDADAEQDRADD